MFRPGHSSLPLWKAGGHSGGGTLLPAQTAACSRAVEEGLLAAGSVAEALRENLRAEQEIYHAFIGACRRIIRPVQAATAIVQVCSPLTTSPKAAQQCGILQVMLPLPCGLPALSEKVKFATA